MIILVTGRIKSGKDTSSEIIYNQLKEKYKDKHVNISMTAFASSGKRFIENMYGLKNNELNTHEGKERICFGDKTYRDALQVILEGIRSFDSCIFVKKMYSTFLESYNLNKNTILIINDFRFQEELNYTKQFCLEHKIPYRVFEIKRSTTFNEWCKIYNIQNSSMYFYPENHLISQDDFIELIEDKKLKELLNHISEVDLKNLQYMLDAHKYTVIHNNSTIDSLYTKIKETL